MEKWKSETSRILAYFTQLLLYILTKIQTDFTIVVCAFDFKFEGTNSYWMKFPTTYRETIIFKYLFEKCCSLSKTNNNMPCFNPAVFLW